MLIKIIIFLSHYYVIKTNVATCTIADLSANKIITAETLRFPLYFQTSVFHGSISVNTNYIVLYVYW